MALEETVELDKAVHTAIGKYIYIIYFPDLSANSFRKLQFFFKNVAHKIGVDVF